MFQLCLEGNVYTLHAVFLVSKLMTWFNMTVEKEELILKTKRKMYQKEVA